MQGGDLRALLAAVLVLAAVLIPVAEAQRAGATADFVWTPESPVAGQPIAFQDRSDPGAYTLHRQRWWDFGNGFARQYVGLNLTYAYPEPGTYEVSLTVYPREYGGNPDTVKKTVVVRPPPVPAVAWSVEGPRLLVDGRNSTSPYGAIVSHKWEWGDNTSSTGAQAAHQYAEPGTYLVNLSIVDDKGNPATLRQGLFLPDKPPAVAFAGPDRVAVGTSAAFADASVPGFAPISSWTWLLDGEEAATGSAFSYSFGAPGVHNVTLRVQDARGHVANATREVRVLFAPNATFETSLERRTLSVDASNTTDDGTLASYAWDWGDGTPASHGVLAAHEYRAAGDYVVNLTVTDHDGMRSWTTRAVQIRGGSAIAAFDVAPSTADVGEEIRFLDASVDPEGPLAAWLWEFGDGQTSTSRQTTHVYREPGRYVVNLTITDAQGLLTRATRAVTIVAPPPPPPATTPPPASSTPATPVVTETPPEPIDGAPVETSPVPVTRAATPTPAGTPTRSESPGFGLAALALALVGVGLVLRRR